MIYHLQNRFFPFFPRIPLFFKNRQYKKGETLIFFLLPHGNDRALYSLLCWLKIKKKHSEVVNLNADFFITLYTKQNNPSPMIVPRRFDEFVGQYRSPFILAHFLRTSELIIQSVDLIVKSESF